MTFVKVRFGPGFSLPPCETVPPPPLSPAASRHLSASGGSHHPAWPSPLEPSGPKRRPAGPRSSAHVLAAHWPAVGAVLDDGNGLAGAATPVTFTFAAGAGKAHVEVVLGAVAGVCVEADSADVLVDSSPD